MTGLKHRLWQEYMFACLNVQKYNIAVAGPLSQTAPKSHDDSNAEEQPLVPGAARRRGILGIGHWASNLHA